MLLTQRQQANFYHIMYGHFPRKINTHNILEQANCLVLEISHPQQPEYMPELPPETKTCIPTSAEERMLGES